MKILVDIGHPAHVHLFKNMIWILQNKGHEIKITCRDKDVTVGLLDKYGFKSENIGGFKERMWHKAIELIKIDYELYKIAKKFRPDIMVGWSAIYTAHVSELIGGVACISFEDDDTHHTWWRHFYIPFTDVICTSTSFKKHFGKKHIRFNGYEELAYLHPKYFKPDSSVLDELNLSENNKFVILRFVSWHAPHDRNESGFSFKNTQEIIELVKNIEKYGEVFITSEEKLPSVIEPYNVKISPEKLHDLLYFAQMYIGEGATMAAEAAMLGTPSIYVSSIQLGFINELRDKYGLVYTCWGYENALKIATGLLNNPKLNDEWQNKREKLLKESVDVTEFMVKLIEGILEGK